jgi:hypothetical protein
MIGDYAKWRPVFDKYKSLRDNAGLSNVRVYRNADDPKELIVWSDTSDVAKAREALGSEEIRNAMQEARVIGPHPKRCRSGGGFSLPLSPIEDYTDSVLDTFAGVPPFVYVCYSNAAKPIAIYISQGSRNVPRLFTGQRRLDG